MENSVKISEIRRKAKEFIEEMGISGWRVETFQQDVVEFLLGDGDIQIDWDDDDE